MGLGERPSVCLKVTAHPYAMESRLGSGTKSVLTSCIIALSVGHNSLSAVLRMGA